MNGILVINKDLGYTSRDVVNIVSKQLDTKKVGHTGTLDPNASGVLVICVGQALKVCELLTNHDKEYVAGITLGLETDTLDMDGTVQKDINVKIDDYKITEVVNSFIGKYNQQVPKYSAVKVNGKKLYEYARKNIPIKLPSKEVEIKNIEIIDDIVHKDGKVFFKIKCTVSKGTYIRSLVRDIGNKLGVPSVMNSLIRTRLGKFKIDEGYSIDDIKNDKYTLINIMDAFPNIPKIKVNDDIAFKVKNGVILDKFFDSDMAFIVDNNDILLALYKLEKNKCRTYKMFL